MLSLPLDGGVPGRGDEGRIICGDCKRSAASVNKTVEKDFNFFFFLKYFWPIEGSLILPLVIPLGGLGH